MSEPKKYGSDKTRSKTKSPALWQIFFDEQAPANPPDAKTVDATHEELENGKAKKTKKTGDGIVYQGLLDAYGDSSDEDPDIVKDPGSEKVEFDKDHQDFLKFQKKREQMMKESVLDGRVHFVSNPNADKPYNPRHWESMPINGSRSQFFSGDRTRIRSDSDLELAWPSGRRKWSAPFRTCRKECSTLEFWRSYIVVIAVGLFITGLYVAVIVSIVKGMA